MWVSSVCWYLVLYPLLQVFCLSAAIWKLQYLGQEIPWSVDLSWFSKFSKTTENPCPHTGTAMVSSTRTEVSGPPAACAGWTVSGGNWLGSPEPHSDEERQGASDSPSQVAMKSACLEYRSVDFDKNRVALTYLYNLIQNNIDVLKSSYSLSFPAIAPGNHCFLSL